MEKKQYKKQMTITMKNVIQNIMKKTKIIGFILIMTLGAVLLTGCGGSLAGNNTPDTDSTKTEADGKNDKTDTDDKKDASKEDSGKADSMTGEWEFLAEIYTSDDPDGSFYEYITVCTDDDSPNSKIRIYNDDGKYLLNYVYSGFESSEKIAGAELTYEDKAAYEDSPSSWHMLMKDPFADDETDEENCRFSLTDDDRLIVSSEYSSDSDDEYPYHYLTRDIYLRKGSKEFDDPENLPYFETVTVSNAEELLKNIGNCKKIILKDGDYNFSEVDIDKINNRHIIWEYGEMHIDNVYNMCLEAEEGADVGLYVNDPYSPVVSFNYGKNITIRDVTAGHMVEPGYCSGSVLYFNGIDGVNIDKCRMFGCGTYGIEAEATYNINVTDSDIYECSYGLVSLSNVGTASFKNCTMRDSGDLSMICIFSSYGVTFEECKFKNNRCDGYDTCNFVDLGEYDTAAFRKCTFINNKYNVFSNREVTVEYCTSDNNETTFSDTLNYTYVPDKESICLDYESAKKRQAEIDNQLKDDLLPQQSLNNLAYEEYKLWDDLLNQMWSYLQENLDEAEKTVLTDEERAWIKEKEAAMKEAGAEMENGSMQPLLEYATGASYTRDRVEALYNKYF